MNWETYKFRCSKLGSLMTEPKEKSPLRKRNEAAAALEEARIKYADTANKNTKTAEKLLQKIYTLDEEFEQLDRISHLPHLSETTKTYLNEIYISEVYGRDKDIMNKFMQKGLLCEEDSITLLTKVLKRYFNKNAEHFENEYIKGTPDIIEADKVVDVKTSWDIWTYTKSEMTKDYEWQLRGYMWLTGKTEAWLYYCLVDAPDILVMDELRRLNWKMFMIDDSDPLYIEAAEKTERNLKFGDIPAEKRLKPFVIEYEYEKIEALKERILTCREYLAQLEL